MRSAGLEDGRATPTRPRRGEIRRGAANEAASRRRAPVHREACSNVAKLAPAPCNLLDPRGIAPFAVELAPSPRIFKFHGEAPIFTVRLEISAGSSELRREARDPMVRPAISR
jgi:hypothetical protein